MTLCHVTFPVPRSRHTTCLGALSSVPSLAVWQYMFFLPKS